MNIAILGAGNIGWVLGKKWHEAGHAIRFGVRNPDKPEIQTLVKSLGKNTSASMLDEAIQFGEVVVFAIPGGVMAETITAYASALDGKILVDAANNLAAGSTTANSMATFAAQTPKAQVYRAFNCYGWENFEDTTFDGVPSDLFYCGPDGAPRSIMEKLIADVGLHPLYVGGTDQVEIVDSVLRLWFALVRGQKMGRKLAFKVLTT